jgi:hypothetical protein
MDDEKMRMLLEMQRQMAQIQANIALIQAGNFFFFHFLMVLTIIWSACRQGFVNSL